MIRCEKLTKKFAEYTAVNHLDLEISKGHIFGLVGPDGSGKTTTMRMLTAIMDPTSGDGWVDGHSISREGEKIKEKIGYMSQRFGLYPDLTVWENLLFFADIHSISRKEKNEKIPHLLAFSRLEPFKDRLASQLSGGMKQKLGLACALIHSPKVLFLDEPTNGVDPSSRREFWNILYELLKQGVTIFLTTSYMDEAERCNQIGLMSQGVLLASGSPEKVKNLVEGTAIDLESSDPRKALNILQKLLGAENVRPFGSLLHFVSRAPVETVNMLREHFEKEAVDIKQITYSQPNLEDAFIELVQRGKHG